VVAAVLLVAAAVVDPWVVAAVADPWVVAAVAVDPAALVLPLVVLLAVPWADPAALAVPLVDLAALAVPSVDPAV
jgi:hypothetical protein